MTELLAIGGAHMDRTARTIDAHIAGASNPVSFTQRIGGGAFNALRVAKMRGIADCALMSVRGGDSAGADIEAEIERFNIDDFSDTFLDRMTPSYTAIINVDGELITALADMELYDFGFDRQVRRQEGRERIAAADAILIDANVTQKAIESVCSSAVAPVYAMAISPAKVGRVASSASLFDVIFLNQRELVALGSDLSKLSVKRAVISNGSEPVTVWENGSFSQISVPSIDFVIDVTGAGDALAGGTIAALLKDAERPLTDCVMEGIACSQLSLQVDGPLCQPIDDTTFSTLLTQVQTNNKR